MGQWGAVVATDVQEGHSEVQSGLVQQLVHFQGQEVLNRLRDKGKDVDLIGSLIILLVRVGGH